MKKLLVNQELDIVSLYKNGESSVKIANRYGVSIGPIFRILDKHNVQIRHQKETSRRCLNNDNLFSDIDEYSAYWTGFLAADGCLIDKRNQINLCLCEKDLEHIELFKEYIGGDYKIRYIPKTKAYSITITDETAYNNLLDLGLTPRKSLTLKITDVLASNRHFWRGFVDGDGCWNIGKANNKLRFTIGVGSKDILYQFYDFCRGINIPSKAKPSISSKKLNILCYGNVASEFLACELYNNSNICLKRKKEIVLYGIGRNSF